MAVLSRKYPRFGGVFRKAARATTPSPTFVRRSKHGWKSNKIRTRLATHRTMSRWSRSSARGAMPKLPVISGRDARRAFERAGWVFSRQHGSHMVLIKTGTAVNLTIPDHRELDRGTLRKLIRLSGMTVDEFSALLD